MKIRHVKIKKKKKDIKQKDKNKPENVGVDIPAKAKALVIILGEGKSADMIWINSHTERFSFNDNTYFIQDDGIFLTDDKLRITVYFEGISTPLSQKYIKRESVTRTIKIEGKKDKKIEVSVIKGLKYDSKIIDVLLNRGLAQIFTTIREDKIVYIIFIFTIIITALSILNMGVSYYYGQ